MEASEKDLLWITYLQFEEKLLKPSGLMQKLKGNVKELEE
jgi:hypothetical protein